MNADENAQTPIDHDRESCARLGQCQDCVSGSRQFARRITKPVERVLGDLTRLERPAAVTANELARITQVGRYEAPSLPDQAFVWKPGRITLRVDPALVRSAHVTRAESHDGYTAALRLIAAGNVPAHQCHALLDGDTNALHGFVEGTSASGPFSTVPSEFEAMRDTEDQLGRLDTLLTESRAPYVPHAHIPIAAVMTLLLAALADDVPVGIGVFSVGVFQGTQGALHSVTGDLDTLSIETEDAVVELAARQIGSVIVTRSLGALGRTCMIEMYDRTHSCVAVISQFGLIEPHVHAAWELLVDSLPELG